MDLQASQASSVVQNMKDTLSKSRVSLPREKSKRPQLSCNACRTRKVKCDRIQPCTACSLHQVARECVYDLSESERHPILQAEALREKDNEIARLRLEIATIGGLSARGSASGSQSDLRKRRKAASEAKSWKDQNALEQKRPFQEVNTDSLACSEAIPLSQLQIQSFESTALDPSLCRPEVNLFSTAAPYPFGAFWEANQGVAALITMLPAANEILASYQFFRARLQGCSLPLLATEYYQVDLDQLFANVEGHVEHQKEVLAFLFVILAQGSQHSLYDRCNGQWVSGAMEENIKKGDIYVACALQALRLASFTTKPNLLIVQTLVLIGSYFTDAGRFLDSWGLFSLMIELSQVLQLHQDPVTLGIRQTNSEYYLRKALWWWMLQADQQYSVTLSRPLVISAIGDCTTPSASCFPPLTQKIIEHYFRFNVLAREILSGDVSTNLKIDERTKSMSSLLNALPPEIRFHSKWLDKKTATPLWPMDLQIASLHQQIHNYIILLNRRREEDLHFSPDKASPAPALFRVGRRDPQRQQRVLESCREILRVLEYFSSRQDRGWINWSICQQAYNAAIVLGASISTTYEANDKRLLLKTYHSFTEIHRLGIHRLAGSAADRLGNILRAVCAEGGPSDPHLLEKEVIQNQSSCQSGTQKNRPNSPSVSNTPHTKGGRRKFREQRGKIDYPASTSGKKPRWSDSTSSVKISKTSSSKAPKKQTLNSSNEEAGSAPNALGGYDGDKNKASCTGSASNNVTTASLKTSPCDIISHSPPANRFPLFQNSSLGQRQQKSAVVSETDPCVLDQILLDRHGSFGSSDEIQALLPLASPISQSFAAGYPQQLPSLSSQSYASSNYTNSSLHTPSASHPVSPMLCHGSLSLAVDQPSYCTSQSMTQPQTPSLPFNTTAILENSDYMVANPSTLENREEMRWLWPNTASW